MTQITETGAVIKISVTTTLLHSGQLRKGAQSANTGVISEGKTVPLPLGDTAEEPKTTKITKLSLLITHIKIIFFFVLHVFRNFLFKCPNEALSTEMWYFAYIFGKKSEQYKIRSKTTVAISLHI